MGLTESQQNAVDVRDRTLLVSAAAGSGKTYTLTKRIIDSIINDNQDLSRLLIVTFTRSAAAELRTKISKALEDAINENPENTALQAQLIKIGSAKISTIDSFFSEPVRLNFEKLGLPASMRLADEAELAPIKEKIMNRILDSFFDGSGAFKNKELSRVGYTDSYTELLNVISGMRENSNNAPTLISIYVKLMTSPLGVGKLKAHATRMRKNINRDFFDTREGKYVRQELISVLQYAINSLNKCIDDMKDDELINSIYSPAFHENVSSYTSILGISREGDYESVKEQLDNISISRLKSMPSDAKSERSEYFKSVKAEINKTVSTFKSKYFSESAENIKKLFSAYADTYNLIYKILNEFDIEYSREKRSLGVCEFMDMPRFLLSLLEDKDGKYTDYANSLYESFDGVYIDEYQDVNEIQDRIFKIIGRDHRFMVGDIKQSIYGFREAEPSIFAHYRRKFPIYNKALNSKPCTENDGSSIFMSENFRCDECIIDFTNEVCSKIFSTFKRSIGYTERDNLTFAKGKKAENYSSPKVVLNIVQPTQDNENDAYSVENTMPFWKSIMFEDEAIITANQIAELIKYHKNADGSPVRGNDIAVLVRKHSHAKPLISALKMLNIPYAISSKGEIFESQDMKIIVNLLTAIDNPRVDIPLCELLTSSTPEFDAFMTLEDIITVRKNAEGSKSLYDAIIKYSDNGDDYELADKCKSFISLIGHLRSTSMKVSADKLIKSLVYSPRLHSLTESDAYAYVYDCACKYVSNNWGSLFNFLKYFNGLAEKGEGGIEATVNAQNAVTIMTIHQSKGLEFNVCFLFGFGKERKAPTDFPLQFNKQFGVQMKLPPQANNDISPFEKIKVRHEENVIWEIMRQYDKRQQIEEEARIFYVALTRAKERLYISGTLKKSFEETMEKLKSCADIFYEIQNFKSYMSWILLVLAKCQDNHFYEYHLFEKGSIALVDGRVTDSQAEEEMHESEDDKLFAQMLNNPQIDSLENKILAMIPSQLAASKISHNMLDTSVFSPIPTGKLFSDGEDTDVIDGDTEMQIRNRIEIMRSQRPDLDSLLEANKKPTAAEIGTATHRFLQYCNYENIEKHGIQKEIDRLKNERFISSRSAEIINIDQLKGFFECKIYPLISSAKKVYREFKFGAFKPASEFTQNPKMKEIVSSSKIFVQGSIDLLIETHNGELIICDYKTDRISCEERNDPELLRANMIEKHGEQLKQYKNAIEHIFNTSPKKVYIYSLPLGDVIEIE